MMDQGVSCDEIAVKNSKLFVPPLVALAFGCTTKEGAPPPRSEQPVEITLLHTSDIHSRLLPYDFQISATDKRLIKHYAPDSPAIAQGAKDLVQMGGATRLATLIKRERARGENVLWIDTGDPFQGGPIFNVFYGEPEFRFLSFLGVDLMTIGNHEFDAGQENLARQLENWVNFPVLAANYLWDRDTKGAETLSRMAKPYAILHAGGLKIGVVGMGDLSSMLSIGEGTNSMGITPLNEIDTLQFWINYLTPQVDVIGLSSHLGLTGGDGYTEDYEVIAGTEGLDFVLGGHLHIVLDPPQKHFDKLGREVVLSHSGAFMKYLGRLDLVLKDSGDPAFGYEVISHRYNLFPVDESVPEDPATVRFLEPYIQELNRQVNLTRIIAYAPLLVPRFGRVKAGSQLGNIAADAMTNLRGVQADFGLNNTLGIRTDIVKGPITQDQMFNVFPFDNFVTKLSMSGREICELMSFVARRSAGRGCQTQAQFSSRIHLKLNCIVDDPYSSFASEVALRNQAKYNDCMASEGANENKCDLLSREDLDPLRVYQVAANDYIAAGGSGFRVLKFNPSKEPTDISIRDAVASKFQSFPTCRSLCVDKCVEKGELRTKAECEQAIEQMPLAATKNNSRFNCDYLGNCFDDVSNYHARFCEGRSGEDPLVYCTEFLAKQLAGRIQETGWSEAIAQQCEQVQNAQIQPSELDLPEDSEEVRATKAKQRKLKEEKLQQLECAVISAINSQATLNNLTLEEAVQQFDDLTVRYNLPKLSDKCDCILNAQLTADNECRELACVIGSEDNRLETELFETYDQAWQAYKKLPDLCAHQAHSSGPSSEGVDDNDEDRFYGRDEGSE